MQRIATRIPDVFVLEPQVFGDERGFFFESYNRRKFQEIMDLEVTFVQDNHSCSQQGVLRGLHYQISQVQAKLIRAIAGKIFDVAVDLRLSSPTFGQWFGCELSADNKKQLWIPAGFAHGFLVLSETAEVLYKTSDYYAPQHERCLLWNDPALGIRWPWAGGPPILSDKDKAGKPLAQAALFP